MVETNRGGRPALTKTIEQRTGKPFRDLLKEYARERRSPESIASELGCSVPALLSHAQREGFTVIRCLSGSDD